ncbi:hypothetical protein HMPREF9123_2711 [Neisseria bacilliformis ATCC BAA-1200]|uniref:Uncharacterized protein n=1 Tax=Neisseria bacilliformis ATCC BAA-1200 TaxID=888742 RepID=F2BG54_9NEIS|nr:hypothetical protein HMPREF9123_2711 [Neisseria bacilliformis ATCC BAA-1200]
MHKNGATNSKERVRRLGNNAPYKRRGRLKTVFGCAETAFSDGLCPPFKPI